MKKPMTIMLISLSVLFGGIIAYKSFGNYMLHRYLASRENIATVSAMTAAAEPWQPQQKYYGTLLPIQGINVTTETSGIVGKIYFKPGAAVKKGDVLVKMTAGADTALLHSLEANNELAKITLQRDKAQYAIQAISKATLEASTAKFKSLNAQTAQQASILNKKTIRAPFDGRMGIIEIREGQYISVGDIISSLQDLKTLHADFYVPQQRLTALQVGQATSLSIDTFPHRTFMGKITTINPVIDSNTRNVKVQATLENPKRELMPGMFATITVDTGKAQEYITLPQTAISFNSYGNLIFTLEQKGKDKTGKATYLATQRLVMTGETRGDQVAIFKGIKVGDLVVTSGQLKIKNGSKVVINNTTMPTNNPNPNVTEE